MSWIISLDIISLNMIISLHISSLNTTISLNMIISLNISELND